MQPGPLLFGNYFPNHWADRTGSLGDSEKVYKSLKGGYQALLIRWPGTAREGLARLRQAGDVEGRIAAEIERIDQGDTRPRGWHYFWGVGDAEIFRDGQHEDRADASTATPTATSASCSMTWACH